jgi:hypothetical protein
VVIVWSKEAIGARVDQLARDLEGDDFVAAVKAFGDEQLNHKERQLLYDLLMKRAKLSGRIKAAARERMDDGWTKRMIDGRVRKRPPDASR